MDKKIYKIEPINNELVAIALVDIPAINKKFEYFSKTSNLFKIDDNDQQIIHGPVMIANVPIYRYDPSMGEYYVIYDKYAIQEAAKLFVQKGLKFNIMHDDNILAELELLESYFIKDENDEYPIGTWMVTAHVPDSKTWNDIVNGNLNGFSFQSIFEYQKFEKIKPIKMNASEILKKIEEIMLDNKPTETEVVEEFKEETTEIVNEQVEEVKEEFKEDENKSNLENIEDVFEPDVQTENPEDKDPVVDSAEEISYLKEKIASIEQELEDYKVLVSNLIDKISSLDESFKSVDAKVDEFGKQPVNQKGVKNTFSSQINTVSNPFEGLL